MKNCKKTKRRLGLAAICLAASVIGSAQAQIALDAPAGGWNFSGLTDRSQESTHAYPNPPIYRGDQTGRILIQGKLTQISKQANSRQPLLIVNGNPMPLYTGAQGEFARPYAFGSGSNSIEIRNGDAKHRTQFYEAKSDKVQAKMRIILAWDEKGAELDLHVLTPDGGHAFWANPVLANGGGMDVDSVDGAGPEMFSNADPARGLYHVYLNYWGNLNGGGYHFNEIQGRQPIITARMTLILHENTGREKRQSFVVPIRKIGDLAKVVSFIY